MNYDNNRQNAHNEIDHIFQDLLPARNMAERPEQAALCHRMLDAMLEGGIALCDAGTGIGKTYAYLVAGTVYSRFRAANGLGRKPILISTSSIALQNAVQGEYLPLLSGLLLEDGMIAKPLQAVIRKGKSHMSAMRGWNGGWDSWIFKRRTGKPVRPCSLCGASSR